MARKIPTVQELRNYTQAKNEYLRDCIEHKKTFVITGPKFSGETIWSTQSTLPLLEAAELVGTSKEEIWKLCSKIASTTHAPVTLKQYERMIPFAQNPAIVDTVLKYLEMNYPEYDKSEKRLIFDITGYYYCCALISLSDYRKKDCEDLLWNIVRFFIKYDENKGDILLRNMTVLSPSRPSLIPMKEKLEKAQ